MSTFEKERVKLLSAKDPAHYIDLSYKSKLKRSLKAAITREWLEKSGFTIEDIIFARNRHPYWKRLKGEGGYNRTIRRINEHNYTGDSNKIRWDKERLSQFYDLNKKGFRDFELAKEFETTLPGINHIRRKIKLSEKILELEGNKPVKGKIIKLLLVSEQSLRRMYASLQVK